MAFSVLNYFQSRHNKIGVIDSAKVLKAYKGVEELGKSIEEKNKLFQARMDTLRLEFENELKDYEKKRSSLSKEERELAEGKLKKRQEDYASFTSVNQEDLKKEEVKVIGKALEKINEKIKKYAKANSFDAVLISSPSGGVAYANNHVDITDQIIEIIND
jgi:outer membrane protein